MLRGQAAAGMQLQALRLQGPPRLQHVPRERARLGPQARRRGLQRRAQCGRCRRRPAPQRYRSGQRGRGAHGRQRQRARQLQRGQQREQQARQRAHRLQLRRQPCARSLRLHGGGRRGLGG